MVRGTFVESDFARRNPANPRIGGALRHRSPTQSMGSCVGEMGAEEGLAVTAAEERTAGEPGCRPRRGACQCTRVRAPLVRPCARSAAPPGPMTRERLAEQGRNRAASRAAPPSSLWLLSQWWPLLPAARPHRTARPHRWQRRGPTPIRNGDLSPCSCKGRRATALPCSRRTLLRRRRHHRRPQRHHRPHPSKGRPGLRPGKASCFSSW